MRSTSVDLETAELHRVNYEADGELVTAFAYSLSADGFYAVGQTGSVYSVNVGTGEFTQIGELAIEDLTDGSSPGVTALQFDLTGTAWLVVQTDEYESLLVAFLMGPENPDFVVIGEFEGYDAEYDEGWDVSTYSLVITNDADTNRKTSTDAKLFVFGDDENYNGLQLFRVDPTTGFALPVGTGNGHLNGDDGTWHTASQPAYDPVTKKVYFVEHTGAFPDGQHFFLNRLDPATGEATRIGEFNFEGSTEVEVNAFAIGSDGSAYAFAWPESSSGVPVFGEPRHGGTRAHLGQSVRVHHRGVRRGSGVRQVLRHRCVHGRSVRGQPHSGRSGGRPPGVRRDRDHRVQR